MRREVKISLMLSIIACVAILSGILLGDIVKHKYFTIDYNETNEQPDWVSYSVTSERLLNQVVDRKNNFKADKMVLTKSAAVADYDKSGYDKGHYAPCDAFKFNEEAMSDSFLMSNMGPQYPGFNRGVWRKAESYVQKLAFIYDKVYVVTGSLTFGKAERIGKNNVAVPDMFYKVIYDSKKNFLVAILIPNIEDPAKKDNTISDYFVPKTYIETVTGIESFKKILRD